MVSVSTALSDRLEGKVESGRAATKPWPREWASPRWTSGKIGMWVPPGAGSSLRPVFEVMEPRRLLSTLLVDQYERRHECRFAAVGHPPGQLEHPLVDRRDRFRHLGTGRADDPPEPRRCRRSTVPVDIDGTTEPGYQSQPLVEVDGSGSPGAGEDGLVLTAGEEHGPGPVAGGILRFGDRAGIRGRQRDRGQLAGAHSVRRPGPPNRRAITLLGSSGNTIGVGSAGTGNVISGNSGDGVLIEPGVRGELGGQSGRRQPDRHLGRRPPCDP